MADILEAGTVRPKMADRIKKLSMAIVLLATLGGGGLVTGYFAANGFYAPSRSQGEPDRPKLAPRESQPQPLALGALKDNQQTPPFRESAFNATYYPIEDAFTSNLKGSSNFAQISVSVATYYDAQVLDNIKRHETAIRSAILMSLAEQELEALGTQRGKQALQKLLTDAINKVLIEKTGFGGVNNVYFTSFVVQ